MKWKICMCIVCLVLNVFECCELSVKADRDLRLDSKNSIYSTGTTWWMGISCCLRLQGRKQVSRYGFYEAGLIAYARKSSSSGSSAFLRSTGFFSSSCSFTHSRYRSRFLHCSRTISFQRKPYLAKRRLEIDAKAKLLLFDSTIQQRYLFTNLLLSSDTSIIHHVNAFYSFLFIFELQLYRFKNWTLLLLYVNEWIPPLPPESDPNAVTKGPCINYVKSFGRVVTSTIFVCCLTFGGTWSKPFLT